MKKFICVALAVFSFVSVVQAIDGKAQDCSVENEAELQDRLTENQEKIDTGQPACGCFAVKRTVTDEDGEARTEVVSVTSEGVEVKYCINLQEPIAGVQAITGQDGVGLFSSYIRQIYVYGASIIGIICVVIIVVSGIQISMGGANSEMVNSGKERILQALFSMILLFSSALILRTVNPGFFETGDPDPGTYFEWERGAESCPAGSVIEQGTYDENGDLKNGTVQYPDGTRVEYENGECIPGASCNAEAAYDDRNSKQNDPPESDADSEPEQGEGSASEEDVIVVTGKRIPKCELNQNGVRIPEPDAGQ